MCAIMAIGAVPSRHARQIGFQDDNDIESQLGLPSNSTSIRQNIVDTFSCEDRNYGYYADVDNDCQLFHVCVPREFPDGRFQIDKYSFICPEGTIFDQANLGCAFAVDALPCEEAIINYFINDNFGIIPERNDI